MKIQMLIVKLFVLGALFIISNQNLHIGISNERGIFLNAYSGWVTNIVHQIVEVTGYIIKFEWLPSNIYKPK